MNTTTHPVAPEEIMAFLDGELTAERTQSLHTHLDNCAECQKVSESFRLTSQNLAKWNVGFSQGLSESALLSDAERGASEGVSKSSYSLLRGILTRKWVWASTLSAVVTVFALVAFLPGFFFARKSVSVDKAAVRERVEPLDISPYVSKLPPTAKEGAAGGGDAGDSQYLVRRIPIPASAGVAQVGARTLPMIAHTVSFSIVVKDFDAGRAALDTLLARHNGYAAGLNVSTPQGSARTLQASLRIPAPQLAAALAELKALGRVEVETQNGEEVTQQHADLVARLKNSRETEQRLQDVLRTRTGKVKDVLEVEEEIARVRGEIEQMQAEQKTLEHRVEFATIELKLAEEYKAQLSSPAPSVATQLRNASVNGFRNAFESLMALVLFLAESGPTLLLWVLILCFPAGLLWRRYRRSFAMISALGA